MICKTFITFLCSLLNKFHHWKIFFLATSPGISESHQFCSVTCFWWWWITLKVFCDYIFTISVYEQFAAVNVHIFAKFYTFRLIGYICRKPFDTSKFLPQQQTKVLCSYRYGFYCEQQQQTRISTRNMCCNRGQMQTFLQYF